MSADDDDVADSVEATEFVVESLLPWQSAPLSQLLAQRAKWHHATLLHGPSGTGVRRYALHLAQGLLCRTPVDNMACEKCDACRLFSSGSHPDFRLVERMFVKKGEGEPRLRDAIIIDQVRALIDHFLYLTSHRQGAKVVVIHLAEEMNPAAANALLKSLEEPPDGTWFILASHQLRLLKPTVISRCRRIAVPQPSGADAEAWLREQGATAPALALAQAGGAPLKALAMIDDDYQAERKRFLDRLSDPKRLSIVAMGAEIEMGPRALRKERLHLWIEWLTTWSYDLAALATACATPAGAGEPRSRLRYNIDFAEPLSRLAATVAPREVLRYHRSLLQDRALLSHPLNPRLVVESALDGYRRLVP